jgi:hypothetical protein
VRRRRGKGIISMIVKTAVPEDHIGMEVLKYPMLGKCEVMKYLGNCRIELS